jgi:hypothetical protein
MELRTRLERSSLVCFGPGPPLPVPCRLWAPGQRKGARLRRATSMTTGTWRSAPSHPHPSQPAAGRQSREPFPLPKLEPPAIRKSEAILCFSHPSFASMQMLPGKLPRFRGQRRRASTLPFFAIRATLAMRMNRPCSTIPGMSLSWRARDGGSGICPKEQSRM